MTTSPSITRFIGEAERTLQALLRHQLQQVGMTFAQWVAMTVLSGGPLPVTRFTEAIAAARVVPAGEELQVADDLVEKGFVAGGSEISMTERGLDVFRPLRGRVSDLTTSLVAEMPADDLAATRRVLEILTHRATQMLVGDVGHATTGR